MAQAAAREDSRDNENAIGRSLLRTFSGFSATNIPGSAIRANVRACCLRPLETEVSIDNSSPDAWPRHRERPYKYLVAEVGDTDPEPPKKLNAFYGEALSIDASPSICKSSYQIEPETNRSDAERESSMSSTCWDGQSVSGTVRENSKFSHVELAWFTAGLSPSGVFGFGAHRLHATSGHVN